MNLAILKFETRAVLAAASAAVFLISGQDAVSASKCKAELKAKKSSAKLSPATREFIEHAKAVNWQGYTFPAGTGRDLPVVAVHKSALDSFLKNYGDNTVGLIARPDYWHAYLRVGRVLFDIDVRSEEPNPRTGRHPVIHRMRDYGKVMKGSSGTKWQEAVLEMTPADIEALQWFFLYRAALNREVVNGNDLQEGNPWDRVFKEMHVTDRVKHENCVGYVMSGFSLAFMAAVPSAEQAAELRKLVAKLPGIKGLPFAASGAVPALPTIVSHLKSMTKKYELDEYDFVDLKSPKGLMRLAGNVAPTTIGFMRYNFNATEQKNFTSVNKMGFEAQTNNGRPIEQGVDQMKSDRVDIYELSL